MSVVKIVLKSAGSEDVTQVFDDRQLAMDFWHELAESGLVGGEAIDDAWMIRVEDNKQLHRFEGPPYAGLSVG